jgi:3-hydroxyisobutyrate dehydrogenase
MKVGLVGLGKMGSAIAARLVEQSFSIVGWDADPERLTVLDELGQETAENAAAVSAGADQVISIITDDAGVRTLFCGEDGFLRSDVAGKLFIEMSTVGPATARTLSPLVKEHGAALLEAPVMGTIPRARSGMLLALAGGDAADVERARPLLAALTRRIEHLGPSGSGYAMKLCVNLLMASYLQALAESLALGTRAGLELDVVLDILQESPVASPWLKTKLPILLGGEGDMSLDIRSMRKDVMAAVAAGADLGVAMPGAAGALAALSAAVAHGDGDLDLAHHARFFREHIVQMPRF